MRSFVWTWQFCQVGTLVLQHTGFLLHVPSVYKLYTWKVFSLIHINTLHRPVKEEKFWIAFHFVKATIFSIA